MNNIYRLPIFFLVLGFLQIGILSHFGSVGSRPDLFALGLAWMALYRPFSETLKFSLVAGLLVDLFSPFPYGVSTLLMILFGWSLQYVTREFVTRDLRGGLLILYFCLSAVIFGILKLLTYGLIEFASAGEMGFAFIIGKTALWQAILALAFVYPLMILGSKLLGNYHEEKRSF